MKRRSAQTFKHSRPFKVRGRVVGKVGRRGEIVIDDPRGAKYRKSRMASDGGGVDELVTATDQLEPIGEDEGELCRRDGCCGRIMLEPSVGCTCFRSAPCSACLDRRLNCAECGWTADLDPA